MNPYTRHHSFRNGIFFEFDDCPRLFSGCYISAPEGIESSFSFLTFDLSMQSEMIQAC